MSERFFLVVTAVLVLQSVSVGQARGQESITEIPFEVIPENVAIQGGDTISLESNVAVSQSLVVGGVVDSTAGGFRFPDGSVQTRAAFGGEGNSANSGLYSNQIVLMTPPQLFSEICFKNGQLFVDIHSASESTAGGSCVPGDLGFIMERNQRTVSTWEDARVQCLFANMRLPEAFEWHYSCRNAATIGLNNMTGDWEWSTNSAIPMNSSTIGIAASLSGNPNCNSASWGWVASAAGSVSTQYYRCVR